LVSNSFVVGGGGVTEVVMLSVRSKGEDDHSLNIQACTPLGKHNGCISHTATPQIQPHLPNTKVIENQEIDEENDEENKTFQRTFEKNLLNK